VVLDAHKVVLSGCKSASDVRVALRVDIFIQSALTDLSGLVLFGSVPLFFVGLPKRLNLDLLSSSRDSVVVS
jgi:hypothetical protein